MCIQLEQLVDKLDEIYAESIRMIKPDDCTREFVEVIDSRSYYRDLINQYEYSKDCGNQTALVVSTSSIKCDPNQRVIDNNRDASNAIGENVEVSS